MIRVSGSDEPTVSILTPTIPKRYRMLEECEASVRAQTFTGWEHVVVLDSREDGCAVTMNRAAAVAKGEWVVPLADDDLLVPEALETFLKFSEGADVVYGNPTVVGEDWWDNFQATPPNLTATALIRMSAWRQAGGYNAGLDCREDRDLWSRLLDGPICARFVFCEGPTLIYRFHGDNKSRR